MQNKKYLSLISWIVALIAIGGIIGSLTKPEISTWYNTLNRSTLTPPNYVFPIAWTILSGKARETFIYEMDMDPDTWLRARAWALWKATFELCQIADKNSNEAEVQKQIISEVA